MLSRFFIDRPIFATVLSIVITLGGGIAMFSLPIAQYPPIVPPTIQVMCNYPGASAQVVAESVAAPIEQYVNGVEEMLYMSSNCTNDGSYTLGVTFKPGVNLNFAQVLVQNKVNLALPSLPDVVKQTGVTTRKRSPDILMVVTLTSPNDRYDQVYLSNYAAIHVRDELSRIDGVGDVIAFGGKDYSMRIWVDPERLAGMNLNASDVVDAIRRQNAQVATGQLGQQPAGPHQQWQITLDTLGRLVDPEQFANIVIKTTADSRIVRIKDIGHVELGAKNLDVANAMDGRQCANLAIFQLPDANALDTAERVRAKMRDLAKDFPEGVRYDIRFDTTPFVRESINEVVRTLFAAIVLVAIVVLVFLQSWRSSIIPLVAVPVAIIGTFAVMAAVGFSLNNLTLFGLVLAIGIVVDDAIVVVEAVEHHIEEGMAPRAASIQAMREVSGPVIAVALVLTAVFMPCTFISGITGSFFKQFAVTVSVSTVISAFNSLTLSPALAAILLKPRVKGVYEALPRVAFIAAGGGLGWFLLGPWAAPHLIPSSGQIAALVAAHPWAPQAAAALLGAIAGWLASGPLNWLLGWFFRFFNWGFRYTTNVYLRIVGMALRGSMIVLALYGGLLFLTQWGMGQLPSGYLPSQDKGYLLISVQLPDAASVERTTKVVQQIDKIVHEDPAVENTLTLSGQSFTLGVIAPNAGQFFIILKDFDKRRDPSQYYLAVKDRLERRIAAEVPDGQALIFGPPPLQGLGTASGFKIMVEDRGDLGLDVLQKQTSNLVTLANKPPAPPQKSVLSKVFTVFTVKYPQLYVDVNRDQVHAMGLNLADVYSTLQTYLGSLYVNDFNLFGRTWEVVVQADAKFRNNVEAVRRLKVRNLVGNMAPLGTVADIREINGPLVVIRYNLYPAATVQGEWPTGVSSGEAVAAFQTLAARELPRAMTTEWTEITYLQLLAENTGMVIFGMAVVLVFLVLAAQYESWSLPLAIILVVPMCLLSAIAGVYIVHSDINIFTQIGFVVLVGLASKNAVLIVEFAKHKLESGLTIREAALAACRLRLRPILMTSFAFILGVVPLVFSVGAGAEMRRALGVAVFSGMLGVTLFGIFLTPVFFYVIEWLGNSRVFASKAAHLIGAVLLGIFTLGYVRAFVYLLARPRRAATATPIDILERELSEVDRLFGKRSKRNRSTGGNGEHQRDGEMMVVVDHQRGKTDITVVQQTVIASPDVGHVPSDALAAKPIIADLANPEHNGHSVPPPSDERREQS
ncbi:MAG TPA: efflux RND transporter permease subunit [Pirellulales bacterium]|nr:efflux RND transporter permease subunit [Pirellulales bacterium]